MKLTVGLLTILVFAIFAMTINLKNPQLVTFEYYFGIKQDIPLALLLIGSFVAGLLLGAMVMSVSMIKQRYQFSTTKRKLAKTEKEVENLRALPLKDSV